MKIGIMGLRPRQMSDIRNRKFNGDLFFYDDKSMSPASVVSFQRDKDLVFVQVHGMAKSAVAAVTAGENCYMNAGTSVSSLIRMIEQAFSDLEMDAYQNGKSEEKKDSNETKEVPDYTAKPKVDNTPAPRIRPGISTMGDLLSSVLKEKDAYLGTELPAGRSISEYIKPAEDARLKLHVGDRTVQMEALRRASVGQVIRFVRPEGLSFSEWRSEIRQTIAWLGNRFEAGVEANMFSNYVDLQLMTPFDTPLPSKPLAVSAPVDAPSPVVEETVVEESGKVVQTGKVVLASPVDPMPQMSVVDHFPSAKGTHDYSDLRTTPLGVTHRYHRPTTIYSKTWKQRIYSMRNIWLNKYKTVLEIMLHDDYADIQVASRTVVKDLPSLPVAKTAPEMWKSATAEDLMAAGGEPVALEEPVEVDETARKFWCEAYLDAVDREESAEDAGLTADEALRQYQMRFGA